MAEMECPVSRIRIEHAVDVAGTRFQNVALRSKSEWALAKSDFPDGGWAPVQELMWCRTSCPA